MPREGIEQSHEVASALENGVMLAAAPQREIAARLFEHLDRLVTDLEKRGDQLILPPYIGLIGARASLFQNAVAGIGVEVR
jgi:hypothetical protein